MNSAVMISILCAIALPAAAAAEEQPKEVTLRGIVQGAEDDDGNITAVRLKVDENTVYNVTLDEKGRKLGDEMWGNRVEVTGAIVMKDNQKWLAVKDYREIREKKEP